MIPDPNSTVWPPPPMGQPQAAQPVAGCPFKWIYRRAPGKVGAAARVSDIREGVLQFDTEGVIIQGKAVLRAEIRALILVPCYLAGVLIGAIVASVLETACRHDEYLGVRWSQVKEILLSPDKQQACLIYDAPNYAGKSMTFSLAFTPTPGFYEMLAQTARQYASVPIAEGRLKNAITPRAWVMLILLLLFVIGLVVFALSPLHH
jgi:hypothetical protein